MNYIERRHNGRRFAAVKIGEVRLIDNIRHCEGARKGDSGKIHEKIYGLPRCMDCFVVWVASSQNVLLAMTAPHQ